MSTPLVDVDANPRQPGFKSIRQGSKIPSLPRFQRSGSTGRRSPFSVSITGSPSYIAMPMTARAIVSPTPTSKLPRKPTVTQDAFSKSYTYGSRPVTPRSSLPRARGGHKPSTTAVPPTSNGVKTIPPLSCNKPLPSPPIAQFVNPASPPKAQRTLVDAEAGTPTEEQWPILRPENVSITKLSITPRIDGLPQRSVSEGSALRRNGIPVLMTRTTTPLSASNSTPSQTSASLTSNADLSHEKFKQMTEPRTFSFTNPYARSFHALSTNAEVAIDSPLAHKHRTPPAVLIPPRISSKRSSLPLPDTSQDGSPAPPLSASLCPIKPGSTKWPVLETASDNPSKEHKIEEGLNSPQPHIDAEPQISKPVPAGSAGSPQSYYGSIDSVSTRSLAAGSSLNDELGIEHEGTVRVKCLSWHPSNPNAGPTSRIYSDADAILLGRGEYIPAVPILPESIIGSRNQERSLRTLTEQVSKQTRIKTTSSTGSRTPTPTSEDKTVKITPIRSMQPPRTLSTGDLSKKSISSGTPAPTAEVQDTEAPISTRANSSSLVETSQQTSLSQINVDVAPQPSNQCQSHSLEAGRSSPIVQGEMPQKTMQMLGSTGPPKSATCKRLPMTWMTPKSATSVLKNSNTPRSKTTPLLPSVERLHNRVSAPSIRSPNSASSGLSRSTPSQAGARRTSPSRLGAAHLVTQDLTDGYCDNLDEQTQEVGQPPVDTSLRIKAKRSLRNIFYRRNAQHTPVSARKQESKRSSIAGSALAQRIRNSTNFSRVNLARPVGAKSENKQDVTITSERVVVSEKKTDRQAALSAIGSGLAEVFPQSSTMAHYDTGSVVHKILDRVMSMGADSPNRSCGLEIAEAVLHALECSKRAKRSAELAIKHAHDAELNAWRVSNELRRLEKLCEPGFDKETIMAIKQLIMATGTLDQPGSAEE